MKGMLDTGSMACTFSDKAEKRMISENVLPPPTLLQQEVILVGCGGKVTRPKCMYEVELKIYGESCLVSILVVPGQRDDLIIGTNVIKFLAHRMKGDSNYWRLVSNQTVEPMAGCEQFLDVMANTCQWKGSELPDKVGTIKLQQCVTLLARQEHLVWGKLPKNVPMSPGSTVVVEPTTSRSVSRDIMIGRVVTPLWGDRWVPVKVTNVSDKPITLKRNRKLADVSPCVAVEDFELFQGLSQTEVFVKESQCLSNPSSDFRQRLETVGLADLDIQSCSVNHETKEKLVQLLERYNDVFSKHALDCGEVKDFVHRIRLMDERPFRLPYRRVPPAHYQKLHQVLSQMEEQGIIRKSVSEYASPLVLVWKKDGSLRICTDFRWLNARTIKDAHPLPHQSDCLAALGGNTLFSTMDLTSGFYNIPMAEEDKKYTAFTTPVGLHEYNRMPQGLCNSPASFMRLMVSIFGDLNFSSLLCYLDDLLVFAPSEQEALERLEIVFSRLRQHNLKLSPKKCHLLRTSVKFLGHIIDRDGVSVDPAKVEVISKLSKFDLMENDRCTPSVQRIKSVLGMTLYYQHFIPGCSSLAKPLFALTAGQRRKKGIKGDIKAGTYRKLKPTDWTKECDHALFSLKENLLQSVVLAHPDFTRPLILAVDASLDGLGAVLSQVPAGEERARPIAFASKTLSKSQKNYPVHKLEFLALKWSVCEKFSHWLKGQTFTVWTDNSPLTYVMSKAKLDACEQRWVSKLASYTFELKHIAGTKNVVADALSRDPFVKTVSGRLMRERYRDLLVEAEEVDGDGVRDAFRQGAQNLQICPQSCLASPFDSTTVKACLSLHDQWEETSKARAVQIIQSYQDLVPAGAATLPMIAANEIRDLQEADLVISKVMSFMNLKRQPSRRERANMNSRTLSLFRQWDKLKIVDGILYRVTQDPHSKHKRYQLVLPSSLKDQALTGLHDLAGHQGQARTTHLARQRFFWPGMGHDICEYIKCCQRCILAKAPEPSARAPLESIKTSMPMELVCLDFWTAEDGKKRSVDVLVMTDHFTKLAHTFPCANQSAKQVARKLWDRVFCVYGFPSRIHTDQGANFESALLSELFKLSGVAKSHTTAYYPMGNGGVERFNRTLGSMLRTLPLKEKHKWPEQIQTLTFAYNATVHETTGYAPFQLMFGRIPRLPVDVMFRQVLHDSVVVDHGTYLKSLMSYLHEAAEIARRHSEKEQRKQANGYNKKVRGTCLDIGDRVLVANKGERGKRKLADKWDPVVYTVVDRNLQTHTYKLKDEKGNVRIVHRNLMLDISFLPVESPDEEESFLLSAGESEDETCSARSEFGVENVDPPDLEERTMRWVNQESESPLVQNFDVEEAMGTDHNILDRKESSDQLQTNENSGGDLPQSEAETSPTSLDVNLGCDMETHTLVQTDIQTDTDTQVPVPDVQGVRTRAGRVVKKVNRLIESMVQKPFNLQGVGNHLKKRSGSFLSLF
uniref:Gypsy retrotransposon integrase-like protein 1 n=1 Tax=Cyprinus carpio carpio TaxID=630221 RepID=A0A9J8BSI6_CYPCA